MNTTEIIAKLRAQAAELTAMADALETAAASAVFATGAGRCLHGDVKVGDWTTWENVPTMALAMDCVGDIVFKHADGYGDWVGVVSGTLYPYWCSVERVCPFERPEGPKDEFRVIAVGLRGDESSDEVRSIVERFKSSQVHA